MKSVSGPLHRNPRTGKKERQVLIEYKVKQWELPERCKSIRCIQSSNVGCGFCRNNCEYWKEIEKMKKDGTLKFKWVLKSRWGFADEKE